MTKEALKQSLMQMVMPYIIGAEDNSTIIIQKEEQPLVITRYGTKITRVNYNYKGESGSVTFPIIKKAYLLDKNAGQLEYDVLSLYSCFGAKVPHPYECQNGILLMEDFGNKTLEKILKTKENKADELVAKTFLSLREFHKAGRKVEESLFKKFPVIKKRIKKEFNALKEKIGDYYFLLTGEEEALKLYCQGYRQRTGEEKEFIYNARFILNNLQENPQLVHADLTTYHSFVLPVPEGWAIGFIDHNNPRLRNTAVDYGYLAFSPGANLNIETILDMNEAMLNRRIFSGESIGKKENIIKNENKRILYAGLHSFIRRAARTREIKTRFPEQYKLFSESHPAYTNIDFYLNKLNSLAGFLETSNRITLADDEGKALEKLAPVALRIIEDSKGESKKENENLQSNNYPIKETLEKSRKYVGKLTSRFSRLFTFSKCRKIAQL